MNDDKMNIYVVYDDLSGQKIIIPQIPNVQKDDIIEFIFGISDKNNQYFDGDNIIYCDFVLPDYTEFSPKVESIEFKIHEYANFYEYLKNILGYPAFMPGQAFYDLDFYKTMTSEIFDHIKKFAKVDKFDWKHEDIIGEKLKWQRMWSYDFKTMQKAFNKRTWKKAVDEAMVREVIE